MRETEKPVAFECGVRTVALVPVAYESAAVAVPVPMGDTVVSSRLAGGRMAPSAAMVRV